MAEISRILDVDDQSPDPAELVPAEVGEDPVGELDGVAVEVGVDVGGAVWGVEERSVVC